MTSKECGRIKIWTIKNTSKYKHRTNFVDRKLTREGKFKKISSASIKVGDIIKIHHNERVPADLVLLQTTEKQGTVFIRTDQLDGETDWKLRKAVTTT